MKQGMMIVMKTAVMEFIRKHTLIHKDGTVLIAVSGGPDSMALLHFFHSIRKEWNLKLIAVSVDHQLRGEESQHDLLYVHKMCTLWGIEFYGTSVNVPSYKQKEHIGTQVAARNMRYHVFEKQMQHYHADCLALGHHADDQAETMAMGLAKSASPRVLAGIPVKRPFACGHIIRPFLSVTKAEIEKYCKEHHIIPRRDPSNDETDYTRNYFRKHLIPMLKQQNGNIHTTVQKLSEALHEDNLFLTEEAEKWIDKYVYFDRKKKQASFDINVYQSHPIALQRRSFHLILNYLYDELPKDLTYVHEEQFFALLNSKKSNKRIDFPNKLKLEKIYQKMVFCFMEPGQSNFHEILHIPGEIKLPDGSMFKAFFTNDRGVQNEYAYLCPKDGVALPLHVRTRHAGDRMQWEGLGGSKKLKDIFIDAKIPLKERDAWPIVTDNNGNILWLAGLKKSLQTFSKKNEAYIQLHYEKVNRQGRINMQNDIEKILIPEDDIAIKCAEIGEQLTTEYNGKFPLAIGVLKGALPFMADVLRHTKVHLEMDFMDVSSYDGMRSSGEVKIVKDLNTKVEGRDLLIIEDIIDSGLTLSYLVDLFRYRKAKSIKIVTLLDKPSGRTADIKADIIGFEVPNEFVVGYGLDYEEKYRNLPYIGILKPHIYGGENA